MPIETLFQSQVHLLMVGLLSAGIAWIIINRRCPQPDTPPNVIVIAVTYWERLKNVFWTAIYAVGATVTTKVLEETGYLAPIVRWIVERVTTILPALV